MSAEVALAAVQADWNAGADPWNPERLAAIYTADALFFGGRPGHAVGAAAILAYFASYREVIVAGSMRLVEQHMLELAPDCVLAQGYAEFAFRLHPEQRTASRLRTTLVLLKQGEGWKIRQHHFSAAPATPPLGA
jgi:uncharacterized protein (TIGR02246 family)